MRLRMHIEHDGPGGDQISGWVAAVLWALVIGGLLAVGLIFFALAALADECHITLEQYHRIQLGMTLEDIAKIVPCPGEEIFDVKMSSGLHSTDYRWNGARGSAYVTLSEGKTIEVKQYGLANE